MKIIVLQFLMTAQERNCCVLMELFQSHIKVMLSCFMYFTHLFNLVTCRHPGFLNVTSMYIYPNIEIFYSALLYLTCVNKQFLSYLILYMLFDMYVLYMYIVMSCLPALLICHFSLFLRCNIQHTSVFMDNWNTSIQSPNGVCQTHQHNADQTWTSCGFKWTCLFALLTWMETRMFYYC